MFDKLKENLLDTDFLDKIPKYAQDNWSIILAQTIVRVFYFFLLYSSIILFQQWDFTIQAKSQISFIPTIAWINLVSFPVALVIIKILFILTALLASLFPQSRALRILAFISVLEFVSLYFSILKLDVDWYTMILAAFMFIFLPDGWGNPAKFSTAGKQKFLLAFWGCQAIILLTYTMSGIGKLIGGFNQMMAGESFVFEPQAGALHVADRLIVTNSTSPIGPFVIDHYLLLWPLYLGTIYLLLFSFSVAFKPSLHRLWGLGIILFHIVNYLAINIGFNAHVFLLALLFLISPFSPAKMDLKTVLHDLPLLGIFIKKNKTHD